MRERERGERENRKRGEREREVRERRGVSGFNLHEVRYDHVWRKQAMAGRSVLAKPKQKPAAVGLSNVQELFPDKS